MKLITTLFNVAMLVLDKKKRQNPKNTINIPINQKYDWGIFYFVC